MQQKINPKFKFEYNTVHWQLWRLTPTMHESLNACKRSELEKSQKISQDEQNILYFMLIWTLQYFVFSVDITALDTASLYKLYLEA